MATANLNKREKAILIFYLKGTLSDLSKALILFIIFYILDFHIELLYGFFFLLIFRVFSGGIHCKTYLGCFILSLVILSSGVFLGVYISLPKIISTVLSIMCGIITCILTPIVAPTRPKLTKEIVKTAKVKEAWIIGIYILVLSVTKANSYINIGFWLLILHTIQLFIAYERR